MTTISSSRVEREQLDLAPNEPLERESRYAELSEDSSLNERSRGHEPPQLSSDLLARLPDLVLTNHRDDKFPQLVLTQNGKDVVALLRSNQFGTGRGRSDRAYGDAPPPEPPPADDVPADLLKDLEKDRTKTGDKPQPPKDTRPTPPPDADQPKPLPEVEPLPSNIKLDADQNIESITYPDGKVRTFNRDEEGNITSIVTKDEKGERVYKSKGDGWAVEVDGMDLDLPGKMVLDEEGNFSYQLDGKKWRTEKPDGTVTDEGPKSDSQQPVKPEDVSTEKHKVATGAEVGQDANKNVVQINRTDGASVTGRYEDGKLTEVIESFKDGNVVSWKKQADGSWTSADGTKRQNMQLHENGNLTYESDGYRHIVRSNGAKLTERADQPAYTFDKLGRIESIKYANGDIASRSFGYEGDSENLRSVRVQVRDKNITVDYTKDSNGTWNSGQWGRRLQDAYLSADGNYSIKDVPGFNGQNNPQYQTYRADGSQVNERLTEDGSRLQVDAQGKVCSVIRKDGTVLDSTSSEGKLNTISQYDPRTGQSTTWARGTDGKWRSDSPNHKEERTDMAFTKDGEISFATELGTKVLRADGTTQLVKKDGSKVDYAADGSVARVTATNGDQRTFEYADGKLAKVTEQTKAGGTKVWDVAADKTRTNVHLSQEGDLSYQNADGSAVIERSNFTKIKVDKDGDITEVSSAKGDVRKFSYSGEGTAKSLQTIEDTRQTSNGAVTETWTRKQGTQDFASVGSDGKEKVRRNVTVCRDGEYEYKSGTEDKVRVAKLGRDGSGFSSESVEEAHVDMMELMSHHMQGDQLQRFEEMMKGYESRMADLAYLQTAAGKDAAKAEEEMNKTIAGTYKQLAEMVTTPDSQNQYFDQKMRVRLAEQFMFHAKNPTSMDQGSNGTCWIQSGHIAGGMVNHADHMARLLKEVSLTGGYTTLNGGEGSNRPGRLYNFSRQLFSRATRGPESGWTCENSGQSSTRSIVGMIFDQTLPVIGGRPEGRSNMGNYGGYGGARNIMYMVTGDTVLDHGRLIQGSEIRTLMEKGAFITYAPGHMRSRQIQRDKDGSWMIIQDDQWGKGGDRVIHRIRDIKEWIQRNGPRDPNYQPDQYNPQPYNPQPYRPQQIINRPILRFFRR